MCPQTNTDKKSLAANHTMRRDQRPIDDHDVMYTAFIEEDSVQVVGLEENASGHENDEFVAFYGKLNNEDTTSDQESRAERRRATRRHRGDRASRPDASGRVGKKECHFLAFAEKFEHW